MGFPKDFVWGAATAAYQVEGAANEDGRGPSVWDMFCRRPGKVWDGQTGEVACDHYHRYREDVALMKELGLKAYRLSLSWSRILPEGTGMVNPKGLAFYDQLIDELLAANVKPYITLFHWDLPYELYCRGGWLNRDSADWFAEYTKIVADKFSDRVENWITLNEPQCFVGIGHLDGRHAPGDKYGLAEVLRVGHNALRAHGKAVQTLRANAKKPVKVGYVPYSQIKMPATNSPQDIEAARKATFAVTEKDTWNHAWWLDPVYFGHYPEDGLKLFGADAPQVRDGDMETICQPLDFFMANIYGGSKVRAGKDGLWENVPEPPGHGLTAFRWWVYPEALYWGPKFFWERYKQPIIITENGMSDVDWVALDGRVHDPNRIDYTARYLTEFGRAAEDGVKIQGYFHWSLMDNFEWAEGFKERFGMIYVDFPTQKRIPKDSYYWYKDLIASNGELLKAKS